MISPTGSSVKNGRGRHPVIVKVPGVCGGRATIVGSRMPVGDLRRHDGLGARTSHPSNVPVCNQDAARCGMEVGEVSQGRNRARHRGE